MNKALVLILALSVAAVADRKELANLAKGKGMYIVLFNDDISQTTAIAATSGSATSTDYFDLLQVPLFSENDTLLGNVSVECQDSSGTDSIHVDLYAEAAYATNAQGVPQNWFALADTAKVQPNDGAATAAKTKVSLGSANRNVRFLRFKLANSHSQAATCREGVWVIRPKVAQSK